MAALKWPSKWFFSSNFQSCFDFQNQWWKSWNCHIDTDLKTWIFYVKRQGNWFWLLFRLANRVYLKKIRLHLNGSVFFLLIEKPVVTKLRKIDLNFSVWAKKMKLNIITHLTFLKRKYPLDIFCILFCYISATTRLLFDFFSNAFWLFFDYRYFLSPTTFWLLLDNSLTVHFNYFLTDFWLPFDYFLINFQQLFNYILKSLCLLLDYFLSALKNLFASAFLNWASHLWN